MQYSIRTHSRARRLILRLDRTGQLVVTKPLFMPNWFVSRFVASQQAWIETNQQRVQTARTQLLSDHAVQLFGKNYVLVVNPTTGASSVKIKADQLIIACHSSKDRQQVLNQFLKNTASHYLTPRIHQLAKKMKVDFSKITLRAQTTRWGSASSAGSLNFNWRLVHFPPKVIDYVIIHELAHLKHMNHSRAFWQYVEQFDPAYRLHRGWLKRQGIGVV